MSQRDIGDLGVVDDEFFKLGHLVQIADALAMGQGNLELGSAVWGFFQIWGGQIRYIGVGAMLIGGLWAIWTIRHNLVDSIHEAVLGLKTDQYVSKKRTDQDIQYKLIFIFIVLMIIPIFLLYLWLSDLYVISLIMAVFTIIFAFLASALAGYLTGLVGSSNCPISAFMEPILVSVEAIEASVEYLALFIFKLRVK